MSADFGLASLSAVPQTGLYLRQSVQAHAGVSRRRLITVPKERSNDKALQLCWRLAESGDIKNGRRTRQMKAERQRKRDRFDLSRNGTLLKLQGKREERRELIGKVSAEKEMRAI